MADTFLPFRPTRARAPLRLSFCGGGTDVSPYCDAYGGVALNATINRYATATVVPGGGRFSVRSVDYDATIVCGIEEPFVFDGQLDLPKGVLAHFRRAATIAQGCDVLLHNDAPPGSGLGSSSAIAVALINALAHGFGAGPTLPHDVARLAWQIERVDVGILGGRQDQYAAAYGGINFMEFHRDGTAVVTPVCLGREVLLDLEHALLLVYVGARLSSPILERQIANVRENVQSSVRAMDSLKALTLDMRQALEDGRIRDVGALLHDAWTSKKQMADGISTPSIDEMYDAARRAGALGGKISGAGGGGYMFFVSDPGKRLHVQNAVRRHGALPVPFRFVDGGVQVWNPPDDLVAFTPEHFT